MDDAGGLEGVGLGEGGCERMIRYPNEMWRSVYRNVFLNTEMAFLTTDSQSTR